MIIEFNVDKYRIRVHNTIIEYVIPSRFAKGLRRKPALRAAEEEGGGPSRGPEVARRQKMISSFNIMIK